jgi:hypothetical protein
MLRRKQVKGQKQAVVDEVLNHLSSFVLNKDIALILLTATQLEKIKYDIGRGIVNGTVEYSKNNLAVAEVMAYARSMVMNHMKKARELNGNQVYGKTATAVEAQKKNDKLATVNMESLPADLKAYVQGLV